MKPQLALIGSLLDGSNPCAAKLVRSEGQLFAPRMLTILCIDDNRRTLDLRVTVLRAEGFKVLTATTGAAGTALARQYKCDIVVLDYLLRDMSGEQVACVLRNENENLPIVLCSGSNDLPESVFRLVNAFVAKGDAPEFLVQPIQSVLNRRKPPSRERRWGKRRGKSGQSC